MAVRARIISATGSESSPPCRSSREQNNFPTCADRLGTLTISYPLRDVPAAINVAIPNPSASTDGPPFSLPDLEAGPAEGALCVDYSIPVIDRQVGPRKSPQRWQTTSRSGRYMRASQWIASSRSIPKLYSTASTVLFTVGGMSE